ncbi:H-or Na-translocating F-type [Phytophthora nicotianae]|uniref:H-or Na-translocating F-type n=1 Tax=Phytophthora nicotianae TaxID=4792 RepID=A0A0W8DRC5_PHYNI|nr:H-or Na-translocating F-type [Phytophthora nicotianae]
MSMGKGKMWSQDRAMSVGESPPPLLIPLQSGQKDIAPIYKFVLTGGPCAGKTTSLDRLSTFFRDRGFRVYVVPEASTLLQTGGAFFLDLQEKDILNFQWQILNLQISLEDSFYSLAQDSGKPCVILCDRGVMDGSAYMTPEQWEELKLQHDLDTVTLRDTRYIAIFHLVTAADGAEKFYSLENNGIRIESIEQARAIDKRTCHAWIGHPKLYVFAPGGHGGGTVWNPTTVRASRKYLLAKTPIEIPFHHEDFEVEKVYLKPEAAKTSKDYSFVRCRSQYGIPAYGMTTVRYLDTGDAYVNRYYLCA